ncbi:MAG TPA: primosomal protein N', partial [Hyphomicrobiaceae bacterium]|nr:primosomal protein N' [Hyphomicrobiaceae bacterium]
MESLLAGLDESRPVAARQPDRVPVLLPVALDQTYDYRLPAEIEVAPGMFVLVPFGAQTRIGIVWDGPVGDGDRPVPDKKLKSLTELLDVPALPASSLRFAEWVARYTLTPLGMVVRMMMGSHAVFEPVRPRFGVRAVAGAADVRRLTPARKRALEIAADGLVRAKSALAAEAQCTTGVVDGLVGAGAFVEVAIPERRYPRPNPGHATVTLGDEQAAAVHAMRAA